MITRAEKRDIERILGYIHRSYEECLYLYINLRKYGVGNPDILLWIDKENDKIIGVYQKYFDCLHFFTKEQNYPLRNLLLLIEQENPQVIFMPKWIGEKVQEHLAPLYALNCMEVMSTNELHHQNLNEVKRAERSDISRLVKFLMTDTAYTKTYNWESVYRQFLQRYDDGFSRFHFILKNDQIVSCIGTNAELNDIALIAGLLTDPSYKGQGLGSKMLFSIWNEMLSEGKRGFSLVDNPVAKRAHNKLGINAVGEIARFYKHKIETQREQ